MGNYSRQEIQEYLGQIEYRLRNAEPMSYLEQCDREAAALAWLDLYQEYPQDYHVSHNLAVFFHRWALELEETRDYQQANAYWSDALTYWRQVWQADPFWEELADKGRRLVVFLVCLASQS